MSNTFLGSVYRENAYHFIRKIWYYVAGHSVENVSVDHESDHSITVWKSLPTSVRHVGLLDYLAVFLKCESNSTRSANIFSFHASVTK